MNTENLNKLLTDNEGDVFKNINDYITSKIKPSRLYPTDSYGFAARMLHFDEFARIPSTSAKIKKYGLGTGVVSEYEDGPNANPKSITLTDKNFGRIFIDSYTYDDFACDMLQLKQALITNRIKKESQDTTATRQLNTLIGTDDAETFKEITIRFFSNMKFGNSYTKADKTELFNRIYRDRNYNLYFKFAKNNEATPLNFKENSEDRVLYGNSTDPNYQFWPAFFTEYDPKFQKWNEMVRTEIMNSDWTNGEDTTSIEDRLMDAGVPRFFLESIVVKVVLRGVKVQGNKGSHIQFYYDSMQIALDGGPANSTWTNPHKVAVFAKNLMSPVDIRKCAEMPIFTNDENVVAAHYVKRPIAVASETEPELPPTWNKFLGGNRFWDPKMDKLKIACFVDNVLNAKYTGRQALVLGGTGEDGKGTFCRILYDIIGEELACSLEAKDFADDDDFGLAPVFNKKLVVLPDCKSLSKLAATDKFKSLTGADYLDIKQKFMKSRKMDTKGVCVCAVTNGWFHVNSDFGRTRIMPVVFRKNFTAKSQMDKGELCALLKSEKNEFVQWCVDYKKYYQDKFPGLIRGDKLVICTDEDMGNVLELNDEEMFVHTCEKQILDEVQGCPLVRWNSSSEEEEEVQSDMNPLLKELIEELDEEDKLSCELAIATVNGERYFVGKDLLIYINNFLEKRKNSGEQKDLNAVHYYNALKTVMGKDFVLNPRSKEWVNFLKSLEGYKPRCSKYKHLVPVTSVESKKKITVTNTSAGDKKDLTKFTKKSPKKVADIDFGETEAKVEVDMTDSYVQEITDSQPEESDFFSQMDGNTHSQNY